MSEEPPQKLQKTSATSAAPTAIQSNTLAVVDANEIVASIGKAKLVFSNNNEKDPNAKKYVTLQYPSGENNTLKRINFPVPTMSLASTNLASNGYKFNDAKGTSELALKQNPDMITDSQGLPKRSLSCAFGTTANAFTTLLADDPVKQQKFLENKTDVKLQQTANLRTAIWICTLCDAVAVLAANIVDAFFDNPEDLAIEKAAYTFIMKAYSALSGPIYTKEKDKEPKPEEYVDPAHLKNFTSMNRQTFLGNARYAMKILKPELKDDLKRMITAKVLETAVVFKVSYLRLKEFADKWRSTNCDPTKIIDSLGTKIIYFNKDGKKVRDKDAPLMDQSLLTSKVVCDNMYFDFKHTVYKKKDKSQQYMWVPVLIYKVNPGATSDLVPLTYTEYMEDPPFAAQETEENALKYVPIKSGDIVKVNISCNISNKINDDVLRLLGEIDYITLVSKMRMSSMRGPVNDRSDPIMDELARCYQESMESRDGDEDFHGTGVDNLISSVLGPGTCASTSEQEMAHAIGIKRRAEA